MRSSDLASQAIQTHTNIQIQIKIQSKYKYKANTNVYNVFCTNEYDNCNYRLLKPLGNEEYNDNTKTFTETIWKPIFNVIDCCKIASWFFVQVQNINASKQAISIFFVNSDRFFRFCHWNKQQWPWCVPPTGQNRCRNYWTEVIAIKSWIDSETF